jgi:hypothetical protein
MACKMAQALTDFVSRRPRFLALVGPPGSGKLTTVREIAESKGLCVQMVNLDSVVNDANVQTFRRGFTPDLFAGGSKVLVVVKGADLISESILKQCTNSDVHVLLIANSKLFGFPGQVVYKPKPTKLDCTTLARELGASEPLALQLFGMGGPDLNQVKALHALFSAAPGVECTVLDTFKDATPHPYFDTISLLRGARVVPGKINVEWLFANLPVALATAGMDGYAQFVELLATLPTTGDISDLTADTIQYVLKHLRLGGGRHIDTLLTPVRPGNHQRRWRKISRTMPCNFIFADTSHGQGYVPVTAPAASLTARAAPVNAPAAKRMRTTAPGTASAASSSQAAPGVEEECTLTPSEAEEIADQLFGTEPVLFTKGSTELADFTRASNELDTVKQAVVKWKNGMNIVRYGTAFMVEPLEPTVPYAEFRKLFEPIKDGTELRTQHYILAEFPLTSPEETQGVIHDMMERALKADKLMSFDLARIDATTASVFIHKPSFSRMLHAALSHASVILRPVSQKSLGAEAARAAIIRLFETRTHHAVKRYVNMQVEYPEENIDDESDRFQELCDGLRDQLVWSSAQSEWTKFCGAAKLAKHRGSQTEFQRDCMIVKAELTKYVDLLSAAVAMCKDRAPGPAESQEFPGDFPAHVAELVGVTLDEHSHEFIEFTLQQYTDTEAHTNYAGWIVGEAGGGKGVLSKALGRKFCRMYGKLRYVYTQSVDPLGITTKAGDMSNAPPPHCGTKEPPEPIFRIPKVHPRFEGVLRPLGMFTASRMQTMVQRT